MAIVNISLDQAQAGDRYIWTNVKGEVRVNDTILDRAGHLVKIGPARWVSLFPLMGAVKVERRVSDHANYAAM